MYIHRSFQTADRPIVVAGIVVYDGAYHESLCIFVGMMTIGEAVNRQSMSNQQICLFVFAEFSQRGGLIQVVFAPILPAADTIPLCPIHSLFETLNSSSGSLRIPEAVAPKKLTIGSATGVFQQQVAAVGLLQQRHSLWVVTQVEQHYTLQIIDTGRQLL